MLFRFKFVALVTLLCGLSIAATSQTRKPRRPAGSGNTAAYVTAEFVAGSLGPHLSKPGDGIVIKLSEDLRSNGQVVLRKGTPIQGVVRSVRTREIVDPSVPVASMMNIGWISPSSQSATRHEILIALRYVSPPKPLNQVTSVSAITLAKPPLAETSIDGRTNSALMRMPSVVPVDPKAAALLMSIMGMPLESPLFRIGWGATNAGGRKQTLEIYSHLKNDTLLTSPDSDFEIAGGAAMQLLVGMHRK